MPSKVVSMTAATIELVAERKNAKVKPSFIGVDNVLAAADAVLQFQDVFTPSVTSGVPSPTPKTVDRLRINVSTLACVSLRDELKDIRFLGKAQVVRGALDANCHITLGYDFE